MSTQSVSVSIKALAIAEGESSSPPPVEAEAERFVPEPVQLASLDTRAVEPVVVEDAAALPEVPEPPEQAVAVGPTLKQVIGQVLKGDTLGLIFKRHKIPYADLHAVSQATELVYDLEKRLRAGRDYRLVVREDGSLAGLSYSVISNKTLRLLAKEKGGFSATLTDQPMDKVELFPARAAKSTVKAYTPLSNDVRDLFDDPERIKTMLVGRGDSLADIFGRAGLPLTTALEVSRSSKAIFPISRKLRVGEELKMILDNEGDLFGLSYPVDSDNDFYLIRTDAGRFLPWVDKKEFDVRLKTASGTITDSLISAGRKAGLETPLVIRLAGLFEWDIDFARDLREGDRFNFVYEELWHKGKKVRDGRILAAQFTNQGERVRVVRYTDPNGRTGYYDPKGRNIQKMFIRAPVDFTRISSHFSRNRRHPVYGYTRAHKGVDYAAPTGTPVRAAGDGRVSFVGVKRGFGKLVIIRHNSKYTTAYGHLSRFASGLKVGSYVQQGQTVAHVGATGVATGPHLHYEIRVFDKQVNPLTIQLPTSDPVARKHMDDFNLRTAPLLAQLNAAPAVAAATGK